MKRLPYVRKREILEMLKENDCIDIEDLTKRFNVSHMTIHRDLRELEENGEVMRFYGGVKAINHSAAGEQKESGQDEESFDLANGIKPPYGDLTIEERFRKLADAKQEIGKLAAQYVQDGDVIAIDPSTTTLHMCSFLQEKNITVVTTSLNAALQFSNTKSVKVMLLGGFLRKSSLSVVGNQLKELLKWIVVDKCFLSSHCMSFEHGLTDMTYEEAEAKRILIDHSKHTYVLVDYSKICKNASFMVCNNKNMDKIFTNSKAQIGKKQLACLDSYKESGVDVVFADEYKQE